MRKRLQHQNIVPFLGALTETLPLKIVCDWMEHGRITEYVTQHPDVDRVDLVSEFVSALIILNAEHHSCGTWQRAFTTCTRTT